MSIHHPAQAAKMVPTGNRQGSGRSGSPEGLVCGERRGCSEGAHSRAAELASPMEGLSGLWHAWQWFWSFAGPIGTLVGTWYSRAGYRLAKEERARREEAERRAEDQARLARVRRAAYAMLQTRIEADRLSQALRDEHTGWAPILSRALGLQAGVEDAVADLPRPRPERLAYTLARLSAQAAWLREGSDHVPVAATADGARASLTSTVATMVVGVDDIARQLRVWGGMED